MHIGIDASMAFHLIGGVGRYVKNLIESLMIIDTENRYYLYYRYFRTKGKKKIAISNQNFSDVVNFMPEKISRFLSSLNILKIDNFLRNVDLIHGPAHFIDTKSNVKTVITVYDMIFLAHPEYMPDDSRKLFTRQVPKSLQKASYIIAVSQATKQDIIRFLRIPEWKIGVIYGGVDHKQYHPFYSESLKASVRAKYNLPQDFILSVGYITARKNQIRLVDAFEQLLKKSQIHHALVFVGRPGWGAESFFRRSQKLRQVNRILFLNNVPDCDLPVIYNLAALSVYPSLYEGFGLPVLESMACGVPVITSNISSLPEVAGESAIMVDPLDTEALADAIQQILEDTVLRRKMIEKGMQWARKFCWRRTAQATLEVYRSVSEQ